MEKTELKEFWYEEFFNLDRGLCTLCGNTGVIDTRATGISCAGVNVGRLNWCGCQNGRAMKEAKWNIVEHHLRCQRDILNASGTLLEIGCSCIGPSHKNNCPYWTLPV